MKTKQFLVLFVFVCSIFYSNAQDIPWKKSQLMPPAALAKKLNAPSEKQPIVFNIGPVEDIKGCIHIGSVQDKANFKKFEKAIKNLPKDAEIVIYCGCCPFEHCPNVRPAFDLLNKMGFTNHQLLNLSDNLKVNWIDQGYPIQ